MVGVSSHREVSASRCRVNNSHACSTFGATHCRPCVVVPRPPICLRRRWCPFHRSLGPPPPLCLLVGDISQDGLVQAFSVQLFPSILSVMEVTQTSLLLTAVSSFWDSE